MTNEELMQLLMSTFADEAREQLQSINENLLKLEEGVAGAERVEVLDSLFREAHSLKGASRAVELGDIEAVAHHLESLWDLVKKGELEPTRETYDLAYKGFDAIGLMVEEAAGGDPA